MTPAAPAPLLRPEDVAAYLGVPVKTLYSWRHVGRGPRASRVGKHLRYRQEDVDRWLEEQASE
jgi:excisionase family DNA binding protein